MKAQQVFEVVYNVIPHNLDYRPKWLTADNTLSGLVHGQDAPYLPVGILSKTMDPSGRRIIVIGTQFGNVILHDFDAAKNPAVIVGIAPKELEDLDLYNFSVIQDNQICEIVGYDKTGKNVGHRVRELLTA